MELVTEPRYLNLKHAMQYLDISSYTTMSRYIELGLKVTFIGGSRRIDKHELDKFMNEHKL